MCVYAGQILSRVGAGAHSAQHLSWPWPTSQVAWYFLPGGAATAVSCSADDSGGPDSRHVYTAWRAFVYTNKANGTERFVCACACGCVCARVRTCRPDRPTLSQRRRPSGGVPGVDIMHSFANLREGVGEQRDQSPLCARPCVGCCADLPSEAIRTWWANRCQGGVACPNHLLSLTNIPRQNCPRNCP